MPAPKAQISSRLLNMKFMQRGAATAAPSNSAPSTPNGPPAKRIRLSAGASPSYSGVDSPSSVASEEDLRHREALERQQEEAGETQWVLKARGSARTPLRIVQASFADLDDGEEEDARHVANGAGSNVQRVAQQTVAGRMVFGKKPIATAMDTTSAEPTSNSSSEIDDSEDGEIDEEDPTARMLQEERRAAAADARAKRHEKKSAKAKESNRLADLRRKKEVSLNGLSGISGAAQRDAFDQSKRAFDNVNRAKGAAKCYKCNQPGHLARDCGGSPRMNY